MWMIVVFLGHFFNAIVFLVDKYLLTQKVPNPIVYSFTIGILGIAAFVLAPFGLHVLPLNQMVLSFSSGAAFILALYFFFKSLKNADTSRVVTFVGAFQPILIFLLAFWWLGERLQVHQIFAFLLLLIGGILISWKRRSATIVGTRHAVYLPWVYHALFSALLFSVSFVLVKDVFNDTNFVSGLVWSRLGGVVMAALYLVIPAARKGIFEGLRKTQNKQQTGALVLASQASGALGFILVTYGVSLASVTLVQAMQGIQYVFLFFLVALVSWKFPRILKERFTKKIVLQKIFAIIIISAALGILAL